MKKFLGLILCVFCFCGWTYNEDFESGTTGQTVATSLLGGGERRTYSTTHAYSGSKAMKINFLQSEGVNENFPSSTEVKFPDVAVVNGETEMWMSAMMYFGEASDNASGQDWNWDRANKGAASAIKMLRFHKTDFTPNNRGLDAIIGRRWPNKAPYVSLEHSTTGDELVIYQDAPQVELNPGQWYKLELYILFGVGLSEGRAKMWINDVLKVDAITSTMNSAVTHIDFGWLMPNWNGGVVQDQSMWVDEFRISNEGPSSGGGGDTTKPVLASVDPADGTSGVATDQVIHWIITDEGGGLSPSDIRVAHNGTNVTGSLGFGGTDEQLDVYLTPSMAYSENHSFDIGSGIDTSLNTMLTVSNELTTTSATVSDPIFAGGSGPSLSTNYTYKTSSRWQLFDRSGDTKLGINTSDYQGFELAVYDVTQYTRPDITVDMTSTDDHVTNLYSDLIILVNSATTTPDIDNCYFFALSTYAPDNGWWRRVNGTPTQLTSVGEALIADNSEFSFRLQNDSGTWNAYKGGVLKDTTTLVPTASGYVAFGSQNDMGDFDNMAITEGLPSGGGGGGEALPPSSSFVRPGSGNVKLKSAPSSGATTVKLGNQR